VFAHVAFQPLLVDRVDVEWRIGQDEVEAAGTFVRIVVVAVGFAHVAFQPVHCEIHSRERDRRSDFLVAVDRQFTRRILLVFGNKARALHKHTARAACGIEHASVEWFENFHK